MFRLSPVLLIVLTATLTAACGADSSAASAQAADAAAEPPVIDVAVVRATLGTVESALEISGTLAPRFSCG